MFKVYSPAKVNLWLEVLDRRQDGYHNIRTVFQSVALFDEVEIERDSGPVQIECEGERVPCGEDNIVFRAVNAFFSAFGRKDSLHIKIKKVIPPGRGLGGGSSNAAVILLALNRLYENPFSLSQLWEIATKLGSDVPFFLFGGRALGLSRGEELYPLEEKEGICVILDPGFESPTGRVYSTFDRIGKGQDGNIAEFLWEGKGGRNDLEEAAMHVLPQLRQLKERVFQLGYRIQMTGSGSAFFLTFRSFSEAQDFYDKIKSWGVRTFIIPFLNRKDYYREIFRDWGVAKR